ncbi:MAG: hypothetical protein A2Y91_03815 [Chloroflexi bacterium RBG_13_54_8]|nr:MAG: hypothetical protein A2Y91_03815 [Chloroflexi bacterium RBG_13_54_8]
MIGAIIAKKRARSAFDSLSRHDPDTFLANWANNATFVYPTNLRVGGVIKGKQAIKEWFRKFMEQFPVSNFAVKNICVQNIFALAGTNVLAVEWGIRLKNRHGD